MVLKPGVFDDSIASALKKLSDMRDTLSVAPQATARFDSDVDLAGDLRTALATRGWVNPRLLLPSNLDQEILGRTLDAVAPDVETSFNRYPGKWYMSVPARRRIIAARDPDVLRAELNEVRDPDDPKDPVRFALRALLDNGTVDLEGRTVEELRAIENAADWLGGREAQVDVAGIRDRTAALAAGQQRAAEVARLSGIKLIGRKEPLAKLSEYLSAPYSNGRGLSVLYIHGVGGTGKSTLLAHVEQRVSSESRGAITVHLDFDRADLDPSRPVTLDLVLLQQLSVALPQAAADCRRIAAELEAFHFNLRVEKTEAVTDRRRNSKKGAQRRRSSKADTAGHSTALESIETSEGSERESILYGMLGGGAIDFMERPLVVLLDTVETVIARGEAAVDDLGKWLDGLVNIARAPDVRAVVAGRDPIAEDSPFSITRSLARRGHRVEPEINLTNLDETDAQELLADAGIDDQVVAKAAAAALPCNPLVLRIAGDVFKDAPEAELENIRSDYLGGRVDRKTASRYLTQRVIAHLPDHVARPYALAAVIMPEVTERQVREIVMPVVDGPEAAKPPAARARRVYDALSRASWMAKPSHDGESFTYHPPLRALVLKLIDADDEFAGLRDQMRAAAITWHRRKRTARDRAFVLYHRLMGGEQAVSASERELAPLLARFLDDLPEPARKALTGTGALPASPAYVRETEHEWRAYVEGIGERDGQGEKLVRSGRAEQALALYRQRPTREKGIPPTFFIQALADGAEWTTDELDQIRILKDLEEACKKSSGRLSGVLLSRIYWLTRYELLRRPKPLPPEHLNVLRMVAERVSPNGRFLVMPSIIAAAEALSEKLVAPLSWVGAKGSIQSETRFYLVRALNFEPAFTIAPNVDAVVVTQQDWAERVQRANAISAQPDKRRARNFEIIRGAQRRLTAMHNAPYARLANAMRELRQPLELTFAGSRSGSKSASKPTILLLRGTTIEFHRPLKSALMACLKEADEQEARQPKTSDRAAPLWKVIEATSSRLSIQPKEFESKLLRELVTSNPQQWFSSYVSFVDRSRLLPRFCRQLALIPADTPARKRLARVASTFATWEQALCGTGSSAW